MLETVKLAEKVRAQTHGRPFRPSQDVIVATLVFVWETFEVDDFSRQEFRVEVGGVSDVHLASLQHLLDAGYLEESSQGRFRLSDKGLRRLGH
jgi:hypothetical protein